MRIFHHKTGVEFYQPLEESGRLLYPELEGYLASLSRPAAQVVVTNGSRAVPRAYTSSYASRRVRQARRLASLGEHVTLDACRHGGMTELGDAELAEQGSWRSRGTRRPRPYVST